MMTMMRRSVLSLALTMVWAGSAKATFVTYTQAATASGSLGGRSFTNALVTFTQTADTTGVTMIGNANLTGNYGVNDVTSSVTITGLGSASFTASTVTTEENLGIGVSLGLLQGSINSMGFFVGNSSSTVVADIAGTTDSTGSILRNSGQVFSGNGGGGLGTYVTSAGALSFTSFGPTVTFQATVGTAAVPEPASLAMLGLGLTGIGTVVRMRRKV